VLPSPSPYPIFTNDDLRIETDQLDALAALGDDVDYVAPLSIDYAKEPTRINVRRVKNRIWNLICFRSELHDFSTVSMHCTLYNVHSKNIIKIINIWILFPFHR